MAKTSGLGDQLYLDGYDLSGDTGSIGRVGGGPALLDVTGIDKLGYERIGGVRDGAIEWSTWINFATDQQHEALSGLLLTNRIVTYFRGTTLGNPAAGLVGKQINYDWSRANDGALAGSVQALSNGFGLEWGHNLTGGIHQSTAAENLTGFDDGAGAATDFGLQAYLQVFAFTGTSATVTLQDSDDNAGTDPYTAITGAAFTAATARGSQRIQTARTENVKEWIRCAVTGTFTVFDFAVVVVRNKTAVEF